MLQWFRERFKAQQILDEFQDALLPFPFFVILIVCSAVIATLGVLRNDQPITIGAMIIAPLVAPFIGISLGIVDRESTIFWKSIKYALGGSILFLLSAYGTAYLHNGAVVTENLAYFLPEEIGVPEVIIALASGLVASLAFASEKVFSRISGAAISLALAPPLVLVGVCLPQADHRSIAWLAGKLFIVNISGLIIMSLFIFHFVGFHDKEISN